MIKEAFFPGRRPHFFISNSGLAALMGLARPSGMRASRFAPAWAASGAGRGRIKLLRRNGWSMGLRGICCGSFLRNAQAISLRAAQYHLLTVVEKEMFSRWILARGDFGA